MPRGRARKVGWRREDAALDAMKQYGFPTSLVKRKLKELLNTYGDGGWTFIEEASYKLLIEVILEATENEEQCDDSTMLITNGDVGESSAGVPALEDAPHSARPGIDDAPNETPVYQVSTRLSAAKSKLNQENGGDGESSTKKKNVGDHTDHAGAAQRWVAGNVAASSGTLQANGILEAVVPEAAGRSGVEKQDVSLNTGSGSVSKCVVNIASQIETDIKTIKVQCAQSNGECQFTTDDEDDQPIRRRRKSSYRRVSDSEDEDDLPIKPKRKSCYGWLGDSDNDDLIDVMQFTSCKLANESSGGTKEIKNRWDLKPETA